MNTKKIIQGMILSTTLSFLGCNKLPDTSAIGSAAEDSSASGAAASSVGGSLSSSSSSGTVASRDGKNSRWNLLQPTAFAANICPTLKSANGTGCTTGTNAADIAYATCSFGTSLATWSGTQEVTLNPAAPVNCGTFPVPGNSTLQRQFVASPGVAGSGSRTTANGTVVVIDNSSANLTNFDNQTIATNVGSGYGTTVSFSSNVRTGVNVKQRVYVQGGIGFDHSVVGSISISESAGVRTATGTATVYHNKLKVIGTSTFTGVTYNDTSCVPTGGSIKTTFAAGANVAPTSLGALLVAKSETLAFNGDGTATYTEPSGATAIVKLSHCF